MALSTLTLGGGCFWCIEAAFSQLVGVQTAISGYMGGHVLNPSYKQVCEGTTGHAEVVQVRFDDSEIDIATLLQIFFTLHNPTELNRQGHDIGSQYRSVLFYENAAQQRLFTDFIAELSAAAVFDEPIVTTLEPLTEFYPAEVYHQGYFLENPQQMYCQVVVKPKLVKFKQKFQMLLR
jgi:peptide-methionine (S)-S-oxide reductase